MIIQGIVVAIELITLIVFSLGMFANNLLWMGISFLAFMLAVIVDVFCEFKEN